MFLFPHKYDVNNLTGMPFLHRRFRIVCLLISYVEDLQSIRIVSGLGATIFLPISFCEIYFASVGPCFSYVAPQPLRSSPSNTIFLIFLSLRASTAHTEEQNLQGTTEDNSFVYFNKITQRRSRYFSA